MAQAGSYTYMPTGGGPGMGHGGPMSMPPQPPLMGMDPAQNNMPLQFNTNKGQGKPPMAMALEGDVSEMMGSNGSMAGNMSGNMIGPMKPDDNMEMGGNEMSSMGGMMGMMGYQGMMGGPMGGDPNMGMMGAMANYYGNYMAMQNMPKEIITLKNATLFPPPPNVPPPSTRERPPGCRTIFVGGLPENATEEIVTEIFESCGPICSIRMSKKNFAHIRFEIEESVDRAIYISGYRVKLNDAEEDKPNTGRLHVDYAQARDDLYEWECKQRAAQREYRHRQRMEQERLRPPSPPPIVHYSDHEAGNLLERLKGDETFMKSSVTLNTWLERGDASKRNANNFYAMIQSTNAHVRRLVNEKGLHDEELEQVKEKFRQRMEGIIRQMEQISKVFTAATKQKAWDHFSKAQRKNIDAWRKQAQAIMESQQRDYLCQREEDEMDLSDDEGPSTKKKRMETNDAVIYAQTASLNMIKDENDSLKCQLEAYKNEVELLKQENKQDDGLSLQVQSLQHALQGMQQQLMSTRKDATAAQEELLKSKRDLRDSQEATTRALTSGSASTAVDMELLKTKRELRDAREKLAAAATAAKVTPVTDTMVIEESTTSADEGDVKAEDKASESVTATPVVVTDTAAAPIGRPDPRDTRLIGVISIFLHVHPFGASVEYIWSFLQRLNILIRASEVEDLLDSCSTLFKQEVHGVGASLERRWHFQGYSSDMKLYC